jgi:Ras-related GTP-binding protein A/B
LADLQNLWDCGGQNAFTDNYLTAQKDTIFTNVAVLIYVFDITSTEWESDLKYFEDIIGTLRENSSEAGIWVLINKMDLADKEDPARKKYAEKKAEILAVDERVSQETERKGLLRVFGTTIWDESLYKVSTHSLRVYSLRRGAHILQAWSSVIHTLVPNINLITSHLTYLRNLCLAVEVVVFEAETFLVIAKSGSPLDADSSDLDDREVRGGMKALDRKRFEKISETIKGFRKTCQ